MSSENFASDIFGGFSCFYPWLALVLDLSPYASSIAGKTGTDHHTWVFGSDSLDNFLPGLKLDPPDFCFPISSDYRCKPP
jgi:hypothetical protein